MTFSGKLTSEQMLKLKEIMNYAASSADAIQKMMADAGISKYDGCHMAIGIAPDFNSVQFGDKWSECGEVRIGRMDNEDHYRTFGENSTEYVLLFAEPELRERIRSVLNAEKTLPPDGFWLSSDDNDPVPD